MSNINFSFAKSASSGSIPPVLAEEPTIRFSNINLIFNLNLIFKINLNINIIFKINLNINLTIDFDFSFRICLDSTEMFLQVLFSPHTLQSLISQLLHHTSQFRMHIPLNGWKSLKTCSRSGMSAVPEWLKSLRLHKYTNLVSHVS